MTLRSPLASILLLFLVAIIGCGKDLIIAAAPPPPSTTGTGNWLITGYYQNGTSIHLYSFGGSLVNNNGQIAGVFHAKETCFGNGATDIPYTGRLDVKTL